MDWPRLLAGITGTVDRELLLRNEYLAAENRILRAQIKGRMCLSQGEKATLAEIAHRLSRKALAEVARSNPVQRTIGRLTQVLRASSIVTTGSDEYFDLTR